MLTASNLALQLIWFVYRMIISRLAGTETLGLQSLVMQLYSIAVSVCITGLNVAVVTIASRISADKQNAAAGIRRLRNNAVRLFLVLFILIALPMFVLRGEVASKLLGEADAAPSVVLVLCCIFMTGLEHILKSIHIAVGRVSRTAASELAEQSIRCFFAFILLKNVSTDSNGTRSALIMLAMFISEFFSVGYLSASFNKLFPKSTVSSGVGGREASIPGILTVLMPAALTGIAGTIFTSAAALLLPGRLEAAGFTRAGALSSVGILNSVALPLTELPLALVGAAATVLLPAVSCCASKGDNLSIRKLAKYSYLLSALTFLLINMPALSFLQKAAERLFFVRPTRICFILLTLKIGINYLLIVSTAVLNGTMQQKKVLLFAVTGEALQLILIFILSSVRSLHIYGFIIAGCIGEAVRMMLSLIYVKLTVKKRTANKAAPVN